MSLAREAMGGGISAVTAQALGGGSATVAATGSSQATAAPINTSTIIVTGADGTKGVTLPAVSTGESVILFNNAASTCPVYPPVGAAIAVPGTGLGTANAAFSLLTFKTAEFYYFSATQILVNVTV